MANFTTRLKMNELLQLLDDIEIEMFGFDDRPPMDEIGFFHDKSYTRGDIRRFKAAVKQIIKVYSGGSRKSYKYITKNKEYNNILRKLNYIKNKKTKTPKDYEKQEKLYKRLDEIKEERKLRKEEELLKQAEEQKMLEKQLFGEEGENNYDIKF